MQTLSGRYIPRPPRIRLDSARKAANDINKVEEWLKQQAIDEAASRHDEFNLLSFHQLKPGRFSQADKDGANLYLFGTENPVFTPEEEAAIAQG